MTDENQQQTGQAPRPSWMDSPPSWYNQPPQHYSTPPPQQSGGNSSGDLVTRIDALPEKIVNAIREATGQNRQPPPQQQQQQPPPQQQQQQSNDTPPSKPTFAQRWFGESA